MPLPSLLSFLNKLSVTPQPLKIPAHLLKALYSDLNSTLISQQERTRLKRNEDAFIYGEVDFLSFVKILKSTHPKPGEIFYDLGSGAGKAVFTAALCFGFSKACGIEFLPALAQLAAKQIEKAKTWVNQNDKKTAQYYLSRIATIKFINNNFLHYDFSDGNVILITGTCFSYPTWEKIIEKLTRLKAGSRIVVVSKRIQHEGFILIEERLEKMSWGESVVNIYQKTSDPLK